MNLTALRYSMLSGVKYRVLQTPKAFHHRMHISIKNKVYVYAYSRNDKVIFDDIKKVLK